jgi:hypothetical protein
VGKVLNPVVKPAASIARRTASFTWPVVAGGVAAAAAGVLVPLTAPAGGLVPNIIATLAGVRLALSKLPVCGLIFLLSDGLF